jgi:hypothetical protein
MRRGCGDSPRVLSWETLGTPFCRNRLSIVRYIVCCSRAGRRQNATRYNGSLILSRSNCVGYRMVAWCVSCVSRLPPVFFLPVGIHTKLKLTAGVVVFSVGVNEG